MATLDEWTTAVCGALGLEPGTVEPALVLDLARDVAHGVARPAAPLTAFLAGVAVGRGLAAPEVVARVGELVQAWPHARAEN